ncbi:MAG: chromate resistance protein [Burkholderiaceae bacterium]|nr:chromate resistance protein [Burkholderiaceae bacterium]
MREGVYVLPEHAASAQALWDLERAIVDAGAEAQLLVVRARDEAQERSLRALFDRSELYAEFVKSVKVAHRRLRTAPEAELRKTVRALGSQLLAHQAGDFFPGRESRKAADALDALRREVEQRLSPGEPAIAGASIAPRAVADFQGRTWATRRRPWADRLGTAWLVRRFIDKKPRFVWLADPRKCPKSALGFDFDGAAFTHVGGKVTFEVVAESFGLLEDPALRRLGGLVRYIDVGGIPVDESAGVEMLIRGLQARYADDDALLAAALPVFDAFYAAFRVQHDR